LSASSKVRIDVNTAYYVGVTATAGFHYTIYLDLVVVPKAAYNTVVYTTGVSIPCAFSVD